MKRIVINIFAVIGLISLIGGVYVFSFGYSVFGGTDKPSVETTLVSPDGKIRALRIVNTGGGAAGWCQEFVVLSKLSVPVKAITYDQALGKLVFSTPCDVNFTLQWTSPHDLTIRYKSNPSELESFEIRHKNKQLNVTIHLVRSADLMQ